MDPKTALQNLANVVEAFVGNAEQHRLLAQSLAVVRARLERADALEQPVPPPTIPPAIAALQLAAATNPCDSAATGLDTPSNAR